MKVYIVLDVIPYEGEEIDAVFLSVESANKYTQNSCSHHESVDYSYDSEGLLSASKKGHLSRYVKSIPCLE